MINACTRGLLAAAVSASLVGFAPASFAGSTGLVPDGAFVQLGVTEGGRAHAAVAGAVWSLPWQRAWAGGRLGAYVEASLGRWSAKTADGGERDEAWVTQIGLTPTLRWHADAAGRGWFVEGGIGLNVLTPLYRSGDNRFSTAFNFGDHVAVGTRFGARQQHEIALRLQHFSNAGIEHPNPGENFLQMRYLRYF